MTEIMQTFGRRLRSRRLALGLTQRQLAASLGCPQQSVARWEAGTHAPRLDTLVHLAHALHAEVESFLH